MKYALDTFIDPSTVDFNEMQDALQNSPDASVYFLAGYCTLGGFNRVEVNEETTLEWAKLGASTENALGRAWYGAALRNTYLTKALSKSQLDMIKESIPWLKQAADDGHPYAQTLYGVYLTNGFGSLKANPAEGHEYSLMAAGQGEIFAHSNIAFTFADRRNVRVDLDTAFKHASIAAEHFSAHGQYVLGNLHMFNIKGRKPDMAQAEHYWHLAAEQGHGLAQINIARLTTDPAEAHKWFEKAAELGFAEARMQVASAYMTGKIVPKDRAKAYAMFMALLAESETESPCICLPRDSQQQKIAMASRVIKTGARPQTIDGKKYLTWDESDIAVEDNPHMRKRLQKLSGSINKTLTIK